jgi:LexA-binding, inner membrane-associated putative hydrolase
MHFWPLSAQLLECQTDDSLQPSPAMNVPLSEFDKFVLIGRRKEARMAGFKTHITVSGLLGVAAGAFGAWQWQLDWGPVCLAAGLTALGGMLPDLDSDSGVPVRELFGVAAACIPVLLLHRLRRAEFTHDQMLVVLIGVYLFVRYGLAEFFKRVTVHRGMFHSIPALLIAGLIVFMLYDHDNQRVRWYLAGGAMLGFLSHLVLDELYAVDLRGLVPRLNNFAGSALKLFSQSWTANAFTYAVLFVLGAAAWKSAEPLQNNPFRIQVSPSQDRRTLSPTPWRS